MVLIIILSSALFWGFFGKTTPEMYMQLYFWFARVANVDVEGADCV